MSGEELVHIPLAVQERLFELTCGEAMDMVSELFHRHEEEILELALERLRGGYETYGSAMFTWDSDTRRREAFEEAADLIVYLCSGPISPSPELAAKVDP